MSLRGWWVVCAAGHCLLVAEPIRSPTSRRSAAAPPAPFTSRLASNNLSGTLPKAWPPQLPSLRELILSNNSLRCHPTPARPSLRRVGAQQR